MMGQLERTLGHQDLTRQYIVLQQYSTRILPFRIFLILLTRLDQ